jgi:hypothetical protein
MQSLSYGGDDGEQTVKTLDDRGKRYHSRSVLTPRSIDKKSTIDDSLNCTDAKPRRIGR